MSEAKAAEIFEGAIVFSKETAALKVAVAAERIRKNGYTQPYEISFTVFEVRALDRICRAAIAPMKRSVK